MNETVINTELQNNLSIRGDDVVDFLIAYGIWSLLMTTLMLLVNDFREELKYVKNNSGT